MLPRPYRFGAAAIAVAAFLTLSPTASADYFLDTFSTPASGTNYQIALLNSNPYNSPVDNVSAGLTRQIQVSVSAPLPPNFNSVSGTIGGGQFSLNTDNQTKATGTITYTLSGTAGNLTGATGIQLGFANMDPGTLAVNTPVTISIATAGGGTMTDTTTIPGGATPFAQNYNFSSFSKSGTVDLSHVTGITITLNGGATPNTATDFQMSDVKVLKPVPAPPAVLLAGFGALALLGRARWTRRTA
jgi:hypothetical protein